MKTNPRFARALRDAKNMKAKITTGRVAAEAGRVTVARMAESAAKAPDCACSQAPAAKSTVWPNDMNEPTATTRDVGTAEPTAPRTDADRAAAEPLQTFGYDPATVNAPTVKPSAVDLAHVEERGSGRPTPTSMEGDPSTSATFIYSVDANRPSGLPSLIARAYASGAVWDNDQALAAVLAKAKTETEQREAILRLAAANPHDYSAAIAAMKALGLRPGEDPRLDWALPTSKAQPSTPVAKAAHAPAWRWITKTFATAKGQGVTTVGGLVLQPLDCALGEGDGQGDCMKAEAILSAQRSFMESLQIGLEHRGEPLSREKVKPISCAWMRADTRIGDQLVKAGSMWLEADVLDAGLQKGVEDREINGWSIQGWGVRDGRELKRLQVPRVDLVKHPANLTPFALIERRP